MEKKYVIPLTNALEKKQTFHFLVNNVFWEKYQVSNTLDFNNLELEVSVDIQKLKDHYDLYFSITGNAEFICDICVAIFPKSIWEEFRLILKPTSCPEEMNNTETDVEILYIHYNLGIIDISDILYDYVLLSLPSQKHCDKVGETKYCNTENLNQLKKYIVN